MEVRSAQLLLVGDGAFAAARKACPAFTGFVDIVAMPDRVELRRDGRPVRSRAASEAAAPDDIALLLHTSGTTGRPKRVPLLQRNLAASARWRIAAELVE